MAAGDIISGIGAANAVLSFQPAAGVEVFILMTGTDLVAATIALTDGVVASVLYSGSTSEPRAVKMGITNARYLTISAPGAGKYNSYTGLQVK